MMGQALKTQETESLSTNPPVAKSNSRFKKSFYLTEEAQKAFTELYINRYRRENKQIDGSAIVCEAIQALYEKECSK